MKNKKVADYIPKPKALARVQGHVSKDTYMRVKKILSEDDKLTWGKLLEACLTHFCDETERL